MVATPLVSAEPDSVPTTLFGALVVKIKKDLGGRSRETIVKWWKALTRDHSDGNVLLVLAILLVSVERDLGLTALLPSSIRQECESLSRDQALVEVITTPVEQRPQWQGATGNNHFPPKDDEDIILKLT